MSDDFRDQVALQRHMYKNFIYTAYWRDNSIQTKDIDGLCKDIVRTDSRWLTFYRQLNPDKSSKSTDT